MTGRRRLRLRLEGRVQGVGFRWWTRREARRLGLAGHVRNLPDGTVELEVEGEAGTVEQLRAWAGEGPPGARVDRVTELEPGPAGLPSPFEITH